MKNKEILLARYAKIFGVDSAEIKKTSCGGKWRGSFDYSVKLGDSSICVGNTLWGQDEIQRIFEHKIEVWEKFTEMKPKILEKIENLQAIDKQTAENLGLKFYDVLDVDFVRSGAWIGWFYAKIKVGDKVVNLMTTNFDSLVRDIIENREIPDLAAKKFYAAGGISESMVDFVFHGTGFSTVSKLYTF